MGLQTFLGAGLVALAILIAIFFIMREIMLWYWRINDIADSLDAINIKLGRLLKAQGLENIDIIKAGSEVAATEASIHEEDPLGGKAVLEWI